MEPSQLLMTAARTLAVYLMVLVLLRITGKREIGNFSPFDLLVALMLGEIVDEAIYGDVSFAQFALAAGMIALCQYATGWLTFQNKKLDALLEGTPSVLVRDGELQREALRKERMAEEEVMAMLREQGIDDLREVKVAVLEVSGRLSAIKQDWAEPVQKGDLPGQEQEEKQRDTGGQEQPPMEKLT